VSRLQLDDDKAPQLEVVEEEIDLEVLVTDLELHLPSDEREPRAHLEEEAFKVIDQCLLDLALTARVGSAEEVKQVRIFERLRREV
jgi:hypothetical protein